MKVLRKVLCFLFLVVITASGFACSSKSDTSSSDSESGQSGGNDTPQNTPTEVYVPYTASEIMGLGSEYLDEFFGEVETDLGGGDSADVILSGMKVLYLNASKMMKNISEFEGLLYNSCVRGSALEVGDDSEKPNRVEKFIVTFSGDDSDGNSKVNIKIQFSYKSKDKDWNYDYYEFLIKTNKARGEISCNFAIERSVEKTGESDSTANYYCVDLSGKIGDDANKMEYKCYQFLRNKKINDYTQVSVNNIEEFKFSKFDGEIKTNLSNTSETKELLRNPSSEISLLATEKVRTVNQGLQKISGSAVTTIKNLSEKLTIYVDANLEIN